MAQYDDEEIGDLEEAQEEGEIKGGLDFNQNGFDDIMNEFITKYRRTLFFRQHQTFQSNNYQKVLKSNPRNN
jgi:hypothetical protein